MLCGWKGDSPKTGSRWFPNWKKYVVQKMKWHYAIIGRICGIYKNVIPGNDFVARNHIKFSGIKYFFVQLLMINNYFEQFC